MRSTTRRGHLSRSPLLAPLSALPSPPPEVKGVVCVFIPGGNTNAFFFVCFCVFFPFKFGNNCTFLHFFLAFFLGGFTIFAGYCFDFVEFYILARIFPRSFIIFCSLCISNKFFSICPASPAEKCTPGELMEDFICNVCSFFCVNLR